MVAVTMPQLGETVSEGTVTTWFKDVGDTVAVGEVLFEVATDKVDTEVASTAAGVLRQILVPAGETVAVGTALAVVGDDAPLGEVAAAAPPGRPDEAPAPSPTAEPSAGASTGSPQTPARPVAQHSAGGVGTHPAARTRRPNSRHRASPLVRRLLRERGLGPDDVTGSGPDGRILRSDLAAATRAPATPAAVVSHQDATAPADHMTRTRATSAPAFMAVEVDFHSVDRARSSAAVDAMTYLPFVVRAVVDAIGAYPHVSAQVADEGLPVHRDIHLGIAVDLDADDADGAKGTVVPVLRDVGDLSLTGIGRRIAALATAARERRLGPDDYAGGTFTISNPGPYGTLLTAPVLYRPQVAALATDTVRMRPVAVETQPGEHAIAVHPVGTVGLSFDHRAIDGGYAARFLGRVREVLETRDWASEL